MSSSVTQYSQAILRPLEEIHNSYTRFAAQHRDISGRLRSYASDLLSDAAFPFEGSGARAFESLVNHYLDTIEKHMQIFDDVAGVVKDCHSLISMASDVADAAGLNDALVQYILGQVTHNDIIQQGSSPIQATINDMQRTLGNMGSTGGDLFGNLVHLQFGAVFSDLLQEGSDAKQMVGDMMNLLDAARRVLGQWAGNVFDAVGKCLPAIESAMNKVQNFAVAHWSWIKTGLTMLGKFRKPLGDFLKKGPVNGFITLLGPFADIATGKDKTPEQFFSDLNGQALLLIPDAGPILGRIEAISGEISTGGHYVGEAQLNLIMPSLAKGDPVLAQELGDPGAALSTDARGINLKPAFNALGDAMYNMDIFGERGDVQSVQQLSQDIMHNPQNLPPDLLRAGLEAGVGATGTGFDQDPGAALHSLKQAGKDTGNSAVSFAASDVDLSFILFEDGSALTKRQSNIGGLYQDWQWEHQPIESFHQWLNSLPT